MYTMIGCLHNFESTCQNIVIGQYLMFHLKGLCTQLYTHNLSQWRSMTNSSKEGMKKGFNGSST